MIVSRWHSIKCVHPSRCHYQQQHLYVGNGDVVNTSSFSKVSLDYLSAHMQDDCKSRNGQCETKCRGGKKWNWKMLHPCVLVTEL